MWFTSLFIYSSLLNDAASSSDCTAQADDDSMGKVVDAMFHYPRVPCEGTEENHERPQWGLPVSEPRFEPRTY
jgi:hypothetical protein